MNTVFDGMGCKAPEFRVAEKGSRFTQRSPSGQAEKAFGIQSVNSFTVIINNAQHLISPIQCFFIHCAFPNCYLIE